ncbi:MAG TPA: NAD-binding protein [Myxococcota bacterium]|nr:NAD-binding protein [Myxococcota bacterium]
MRVIVIGGGAAGLAVALALSREGCEVEVLEGDATPLPASPMQAFERWDRRGAPQVWHSHAFLARLRNLLLARLPDFHAALLEHGAYEVRFGSDLPPTLRDFRPEPGDEELVLLACRRITFEWVARRLVESARHVRWHSGARVEGLVGELDAATGLPRVVGVRVRGDGGAWESRADLVVDASGRRSKLPRWLAGIGAAPVEEESEDCGIFYCSRFHRLRPGGHPPSSATLVGADLGYMKYAIFPGDSGIFSVTLAASPEDEPLRAILRPRAFDAAARALPALRAWLDPARSEPVSPVRGMRNLRNRRARFVRGGEPVALGVHAVGDAAIHTNPLYGRGCTLAFVHAYALLDALRAHPADPVARARAFHEATERELGPWYTAAREQDREARRVAAAQRAGEEPDAPVSSDPGARIDPRAFMRSVIREGLLPALRTDAAVLRAFVRSFNLLSAPDALVADPAVFGRILATWRTRETLPPAELQGPARQEMVELLARVA